jgi:hypothetical protein
VRVVRGVRLRLGLGRVTALVHYLTAYPGSLFDNAAARTRRGSFIRLLRIPAYGSAEADVVYVGRRA